MSVPSDFDVLQAAITHDTCEYISVNTLKRLWGYNNSYATCRRFTLNVLSRYCGCNDWDDWVNSNTSNATSQLYLSDRLATEELTPGTLVQLTWSPGRNVVVAYHGNYEFEVLESINAKLVAGDRFKCQGFVSGQPLVLNNVMLQQTNRQVGYIAGKQGGISFSVLPKDYNQMQ